MLNKKLYKKIIFLSEGSELRTPKCNLWISSLSSALYWWNDLSFLIIPLVLFTTFIWSPVLVKSIRLSDSSFSAIFKRFKRLDVHSLMCIFACDCWWFKMQCLLIHQLFLSPLLSLPPPPPPAYPYIRLGYRTCFKHYFTYTRLPRISIFHGCKIIPPLFWFPSPL